ncbi:MAG: hypothetical protein ABMA64_25460 [Myxococcota bacterium]
MDPYASYDGSYEITFDLSVKQRGSTLEGDGVGTWGGTDYRGLVGGQAVRDDHLTFELVSTQESVYSTYDVVFGFDGQITGDRMTGACGVTSEGSDTLDGELTLRR